MQKLIDLEYSLKVFRTQILLSMLYVSRKAGYVRVDDISQIQIKGYDCILQGKACSTKGGLIIYLHEKCSHGPELKVKLNTCSHG